MRLLQTRLPALEEALAAVASAEEECRAANIDENDYTVFTLQDLEFEHELKVQGVSKKIAFIDNQVRRNYLILYRVIKSVRRLSRGT